MKLVLFRPKGDASAALNIGVLVEDGAKVADVSAALVDKVSRTVHSMRVFLEMGEQGMDIAKAAASDSKYFKAVADVDLRAPIYDP